MSFDFKLFSSRLVKYNLVSLITLIIDLGLVYLFTSYFHIYYLISVMLGFCIAVILGYIFGRIWIFTETAQKVKRGLFIALLVSIIVLLFITSTMWILVEIVHINYMIARISIAIIAGILNFILDSKYTYIVSHFKN